MNTYFRLGLRNLWRRPGLSALNVVGLAVGMAVCLLIGRYVQDEWNHDRFHEHADRIVRISSQITQPASEPLHLAPAPGPLAPALEAESPEVESVTRLVEGPSVLAEGSEEWEVDELLYADPSFFQIFSFELLAGDPSAVLGSPGSLVITESLAQRLFGSTNPLGREVETGNGRLLTVRGLVADPPPNSHFSFQGLVSMSTLQGAEPKPFENWATVRFWTYALLSPGTDRGRLDRQLADLVDRHAASRYEEFDASLDLDITPLTEVYMHGEGLYPIGSRGNPTVLSVFVLVAIFVLAIAGINFVNLSTARSAERAREVGVRKTLGASRGPLVAQFLGEAVLVSLLALTLALALAYALLPLFRTISSSPLAGGLIPNVGVGLVLVGAALAVGLLAGAYPAFVLARFEPARVLRGSFRGSADGQLLRRSLVVLQFAVAISLIAATGIVDQQLRYVQSQDLGFPPHEILVLELGRDPSTGPTFETIAREMMEVPGVQSASVSREVPGRQPDVTPLTVYGPGGRTQRTQAYRYSVGFGYFETYAIEPTAGRTFSRERGTDSTRSVVVNGVAAKRFGFSDPADALGTEIALDAGPDAHRYTIVGVIEDFHYSSLREPIEPLLALPHTAPQASGPRYLSLRIAPDRSRRARDDTRAEVQARWSGIVPDRPYAAQMLSTRFDSLYEKERRFGRLFDGFAGLAVVVACLGLLGLTIHTVQYRIKEIGIRKVLGASVSNVVMLICGEFARLVALGFVVALPFTYLGMSEWLSTFAYRMDLGPGPFVAGGTLAFAVALGTVAALAWRAARLNPAIALKQE